MKTENDILTDVYKIIKTTPINDLGGGIYKKVRPTGSNLEDCIISLINGSKAKFLQNGALYVKLFYNAINSNNTYFEDSVKGSVFENLLFDLSNILLKTNGYSFDIQSRETYIEAVEEIHQYYAILKINFKILIK